MNVVKMYWHFDSHEFAKEMDAVMHAIGLNNSEVGKLADISPGQISRMRRGLMDNLEMRSFLNVCNALDIDPRQYWGVDPDATKAR